MYSGGSIVKLSCFNFKFNTEQYIMFEDIREERVATFPLVSDKWNSEYLVAL